MKVGRPPWIPSEEELQKVEQLASQGLNQEQIADCLGINAGTLSEKKQEFELLNEALKRGKAKGLARVTDALLKNIEIGNVAAQIFYLKTQGKWKEEREDLIPEVQSLMQKVIDKL